MTLFNRLRRRCRFFHSRQHRDDSTAAPTDALKKASHNSASAATDPRYMPDGLAGLKAPTAVASMGTPASQLSASMSNGPRPGLATVAPPPLSQDVSNRRSFLARKPAPSLASYAPYSTMDLASPKMYEERLYDPAGRSLSGPKLDLVPLYPPIEPYARGMLRVSDIHELYWEWSGNPHGTPAMFVHGGPGGGCSRDDRRWFNPAHYRILCLDQRGAGQSTPRGETRENTTADLVHDLELVRTHFSIDQWVVMGHSWGSALSLAYAEAHPSRVSALIVAGMFTARPSEAAFLLGGKGTAHLFPDLWDAFQSFIPPAERSDLIGAYHTRLNSPDLTMRSQAAYHWTTYEWAAANFYVDPAAVKNTAPTTGQEGIDVARIEAHYFTNGCFLSPGQLLEPAALDRIRHIPAFIVQGRYDVICPPSTAWELHRLWPEARFLLVPDAGHMTAHAGMVSALVEATDLFKGLTTPPKSFSARTRGAAARAHSVAASHAHHPDPDPSHGTGHAADEPEDQMEVMNPAPFDASLSAGRATPDAQAQAGLRPRTPSASSSLEPAHPSRRFSSGPMRYSPLRVTGESSHRRMSMQETRRGASLSLRRPDLPTPNTAAVHVHRPVTRDTSTPVRQDGRRRASSRLAGLPW